MPITQRQNKNLVTKSYNNIHSISSRNLGTLSILFDEIKVVVCLAFAESITSLQNVSSSSDKLHFNV